MTRLWGHRPPSRLAALLLLLVVTLPPLALAGDNKADSDRLFVDGLHLFEQKDFAAARQKFADAYSKYPSPNSLLNLARSEQLSNRYIDAIAHYRAYIGLPDNPRISASDRGSARIKLDECLAKIGRVQIDAPERAHVTIDGLAVTWRPGETFDVLPGDHKVDIVVDGTTKTRTAMTTAGQVSSVKWDDPPPPPPPPPPPEIKVDIKPIPEVKIVEVPATPVITPPPPEVKPIVWKHETKWPAVKVGSAVALGVISVGAFIVAPSLLVASLGAADDADKLAAKLGPTFCASNPMNAQCAQLANDRGSQNNYAVASALFWVFGALALAGAITVVALWPNIHPLVKATGDGFSIRF